MLTVSRTYTLDNPNYHGLVPSQGRCLRCHRFGVYAHGEYARLTPGQHSAKGMALAKVFVPRFWCISGKHTFSILPRPLVRRLRVSLPVLIFLSLRGKSWDALEGLLNISRSTLARWLKVAKRLADKLPEILAVLGITWISLFQRVSLLQYPMTAEKTDSTIPATAI